MLKDPAAARDYRRAWYAKNAERQRALKNARYAHYMQSPEYREKRRAEANAFNSGGYRESVVENLLVQLCNERKWFIRKIVYPGRRGCPDRLVILPDGRVFFVELKRPRGGKLSKHQVDEHVEFALQCAPVAVLWSIEDVRAWVASK